MEKLRPSLRPDIQAAVQPLIDEARAEGYAAGLEAAANWHDGRVELIHPSYDGPTRVCHVKSAKAIRALGKDAA